MAPFQVKTKKEDPTSYLYVREIARVDGKPKVISQIHIGSPEKVAGLLSGKEIVDTLKKGDAERLEKVGRKHYFDAGERMSIVKKETEA